MHKPRGREQIGSATRRQVRLYKLPMARQCVCLPIGMPRAASRKKLLRRLPDLQRAICAASMIDIGVVHVRHQRKEGIDLRFGRGTSCR